MNKPTKRRFTIEPLEDRITPSHGFMPWGCGCGGHGFHSQVQTQAQAQAQAQEAQVFLWAFPNCVLAFDLPGQVQAQEILRPRPPTQPPIEPN